MANKRNGTIYIGITNDLSRRVAEHRIGSTEGFTKKYKLHKLVYYEIYNNPNDAIWREKCLKEWPRKWKLELIEKENQEWKDLNEEQ